MGILFPCPFFSPNLLIPAPGQQAPITQWGMGNREWVVADAGGAKPRWVPVSMALITPPIASHTEGDQHQ